MTRHPEAFAICSAKLPTPLPAAITSTVSPASMRALWINAPCALRPAVGAEPASSNERFSGIGNVPAVDARASSACVAEDAPKTRCPTSKPRTSLPKPSTTPAKSRPPM